MRSSTRRMVCGPTAEQSASIASSPEPIRRWAAALLSVQPDNHDAPASEDPQAWADRKHQEGARILAVLASGQVEPGYPQLQSIDDAGNAAWVWTSSGARTPPYHPNAAEQAVWALDDNFGAVLGSYLVDVGTLVATSGLFHFDPEAELVGVATDHPLAGVKPGGKDSPVDMPTAVHYWHHELEKLKPGLLGLTKWLPTALGAAGSVALRSVFPFLPKAVVAAPLVVGLGVQAKRALTAKAENDKS